MNNFGFGNLQFIPGVGYVQAGTQTPANFAQRAARGLGDEGAVMMISGLGASGPGEPIEGPRVPTAFPASIAPSGGTPPVVQMAPQHALQQPIKLFNVTLPLWAWLAIAALLGGAGGATLMHSSMKR